MSSGEDARPLREQSRIATGSGGRWLTNVISVKRTPLWRSWPQDTARRHVSSNQFSFRYKNVRETATTAAKGAKKCVSASRRPDATLKLGQAAHDEVRRPMVKACFVKKA